MLFLVHAWFSDSEEKNFKSRQCIITIFSLSPLGKWHGPSFENPSLKAAYAKFDWLSGSGKEYF